jgi:hypothetical protein
MVCPAVAVVESFPRFSFEQAGSRTAHMSTALHRIKVCTLFDNIAPGFLLELTRSEFI